MSWGSRLLNRKRINIRIHSEAWPRCRWLFRPEAGSSSSSKGRLEGGLANLPGEHLPEQHFKKKYFNQVQAQPWKLWRKAVHWRFNSGGYTGGGPAPGQGLKISVLKSRSRFLAGRSRNPGPSFLWRLRLQLDLPGKQKRKSLFLYYSWILLTFLEFKLTIFRVWIRSRLLPPFLPGAGADPTLLEPPKNVATPQHYELLTKRTKANSFYLHFHRLAFQKITQITLYTVIQRGFEIF